PKSFGAFSFAEGAHGLTPGLTAALAMAKAACQSAPAMGHDLYAQGVCRTILLQLLYDHPNQLRRQWEARPSAGARDPRLQSALDFIALHFQDPRLDTETLITISGAARG